MFRTGIRRPQINRREVLCLNVLEWVFPASSLGERLEGKEAPSMPTTGEISSPVQDAAQNQPTIGRWGAQCLPKRMHPSPSKPKAPGGNCFTQCRTRPAGRQSTYVLRPEMGELRHDDGPKQDIIDERPRHDSPDCNLISGHPALISSQPPKAPTHPNLHITEAENMRCMQLR